MNLSVHFLDVWLKASNLSRLQFIHRFSIPPLVSVPRLPGPLQPLFGVLYLLIFCLAVVGNGAVLALLCKRKKGLRSPSTFFICSLALSDLLIALVCVPTSLLQHFFANWWAGDFLCKLVPFLQVTAIATSILTMTCIAVERFQGILYPLHVRNGYFLCHACKMLVTVWLVAVAIAAPMWFVQKVQVKYDFLYDVVHTCCQEVWPGAQQRRAYTACLSVLVFLVPMVTMGVLYGKVVRELWGRRRVHDVMLQTLPGSEISKITRRKRRAVRMMVTVVLLFAACWAPFHLVSLLLDYGQLELDLNSEFLLISAVQILGFSNSVCNPLVYVALNTCFKRDLVTLLIWGQRALARCLSGVGNRRRGGGARVGVAPLPDAAEAPSFPPGGSAAAAERRLPAERRRWSRVVVWGPEAASRGGGPSSPEPPSEAAASAAAEGAALKSFPPIRLFGGRGARKTNGTLVLSITDPPRDSSDAAAHVLGMSTGGSLLDN